MKPLAIDLFCGLWGWGSTLAAHGWRVIGFDLHDQCARFHQPRPPNCQLILQDISTLHGRQLAAAHLIVASPPCPEFSYMAMPWSIAKQIARALKGQDVFPESYRGSRTQAELTALFNACFRLQREASQAAGRHIPLILENVKGAQPWVGPAQARYGSFYLWGDLHRIGSRIHAGRSPQFGSPHLPMPRRNIKVGDRNTFRINGKPSTRFTNPFEGAPIKNSGGSWFNQAHNTTSGHSQNPVHDGTKAPGMNWSNPAKRGQDFTRLAGNHATSTKNGGDWFSSGENCSLQRRQSGSPGTKQHGSGPAWFDHGISSTPSHSPRRAAASALIAKIPPVLAAFIAKSFLPQNPTP